DGDEPELAEHAPVAQAALDGGTRAKRAAALRDGAARVLGCRARDPDTTDQERVPRALRTDANAAVDEQAAEVVGAVAAEIERERHVERGQHAVAARELEHAKADRLGTDRLRRQADRR